MCIHQIQLFFVFITAFLNRADPRKYPRENFPRQSTGETS